MISIFFVQVDTVCNFLGDARHIDKIADNNGNFSVSSRFAWIFRNQLAGYHQSYSLDYDDNNTLVIDVLTVKGSGHFVPNDRQGPASQMIYNFIKGSLNYNSTEKFDNTPVPLPDITSSPASASTSTSFATKNVLGFILLLPFLVFLY